MSKLVMLTLLPVASAKTCCWSQWAPACSSYPDSGSGGHCDSDSSKTCFSDSDCPDDPAPTPTPPAPPPPSPTPTPTPSPTPTPTPSPTPGPIQGFWYGYAGSTSQDPAPSNGWFFSFPGLAVHPPFTPTEYGTILPPPTWGSYEKQILTQGGGDTSWGDAVYSQMKDQLSEYKPAGWDGVCWDWEKAASDHTSEGFNALMKATKEAGLLNILTSTAEGPYVWSAKSSDATDIDWSQVDYFVPQLYGADGKLSDPNWPEYAQYWVDGAGKPNVHGVTFPAIPMEKILWGMPAAECDQAMKFGGSGCVEWAYSPGVKPPPGVLQV